MQADVFGQKVMTLKVEQGPAYGVALLAAVGDGAHRSITAACKATIEVTSETKPDAKARSTYNQFFPIYRSLYGSLRDSMHQLAALQS